MHSFRVAVVTGALVWGVTVGADTQTATQPQGGPTEAQIQEYMAKYATPGEHHQHLAALAGAWNTSATFWMAVGAPPIESTGKANHEMVLGGRYLATSYDGDFMGMPFSGRGHVAFDRYQNKYVETWIDTMGTMVMISEGTCQDQGKTRTVTANFEDPMTRKPAQMRSVYRIEDANHFTLEMYGSAPDGTEFKVMEIRHTRAE